MRQVFWILVCVCLTPVLHADTFQLNNGASFTGDVISFNDNGITVRTGDSYTNLFWTRLSQTTLKQLAQNPKMKGLAEPFIETPPAAHARKAALPVHDVSRLHEPANQSLFGGMFSSSVGILLLLLIYAANIYAGFEVAIFRARPVGMVMVIAAVLPFIGPIIFLCLPTYIPPAPIDETAVAAEAAHFTVPGQAPAQAPATAAQWQAASETSSAGAAMQVAEQPKAPPQVFQRGQFTFNRRFIETKFAGYFGMQRTGEAKNFHLFIRTAGGTFEIQRFTRIAANDVHAETLQGGTIREIAMPFADIQEIQLKPR